MFYISTELKIIIVLTIKMMSSRQIIKVKKLKSSVTTNVCANCKYWLVDFTQEQPQCKQFLSFNREEKVFRYEYSKIVRNDETLCGRKGKYFTPIVS